jgi:hypothetical protein
MESEECGTVFVTRSRPEAEKRLPLLSRRNSAGWARMYALASADLSAHVSHLAFGYILVVFPSVK